MPKKSPSSGLRIGIVVFEPIIGDRVAHEVRFAAQAIFGTGLLARQDVDLQYDCDPDWRLVEVGAVEMRWIRGQDVPTGSIPFPSVAHGLVGA